MLKNASSVLTQESYAEKVPPSKSDRSSQGLTTRLSSASIKPRARSNQKLNPAGCVYRMLIANTEILRQRAHALAHRVYRGRGYTAEHGPSPQTAIDTQPNTLTLLAEDQQGREAATITLVYDGPSTLPCDEIFAPELVSLRTQGKRMAEVTRLALAPTSGHSRLLLVRLFNLIYLHARHIMNGHEFVIEVNPRHVDYYRRLLGFTPLGPVRSCPRVQGAPAVLLRLDLSHAEQEIKRVGGLGAETNERTLYPYFYPKDEEAHIIEFLNQSQTILDLM